MSIYWLGHILTNALALSLAILAVISIAGAHYLRARFRQWGYSFHFFRVIGALQLFAALFLAVPSLRIWGISLAGFMAFWAIVMLLNHRRWSWAAAGILMLLALAPASFAIP
jgi:hypothetical protein